MLRKLPFMDALHYVPTRLLDLQKTMKELTVRVEPPQQNGSLDDADNEFRAEREVSPEGVDIQCFSLSKSGYIGVPRSYGIANFGQFGFIDRTTPLKNLDTFPKRIVARDAEQQQFMNELASLIRGPCPVDIIANARTGTGKTVTALWAIENVIKSPTLVCVPTTYLLDQWRTRISELMGKSWANRYVGHIQQNVMDYEGRIICLGVNASLARRNYPVELQRYFSAVILDEFHRVPTPSMVGILSKYPASVRIGLTATNRRDAMKKAAELHMSKPRVVSQQEVMRPQVYIKEFHKILTPNMPVYSDHHMISILSRMRDRNHMLATMIYDGWERGRCIIGLSDRTDQLVAIREILQRELPNGTVGIIAGSYRYLNQKVRPSREEKDRVARNCRIILATYGIFDTGADIDRLDMGIELTPRVNVRQAIGRILRIKQDKPIPEWYTISDYIGISRGGMFANPIPDLYQPLVTDALHRLASFRDQNGTINHMI